MVVTDRRPSGEEFSAVSALLDDDDAVSRSFWVSATPSAVLIGADSTVAAPLAVGGDAIRDLIVRASSGTANNPRPNGDARPLAVLDGQGR